MIVLLLPFAIEVVVIGIPLLSCTTHSTLNLEVNLQPGPGDCSVSVQLHRHLYSKQRATGCHKSAGLRGLVSGNNYLLELPPRRYNNRR